MRKFYWKVFKELGKNTLSEYFFCKYFPKLLLHMAACTVDPTHSIQIITKVYSQNLKYSMYFRLKLNFSSTEYLDIRFCV